MVFKPNKKPVLILIVLISFVLGLWIGKKQTECRIYPPGNFDFSLFWETYEVLQEKFVDKGKFDNQKMLYGAIAGMVKSLGDPYTVFLDPEKTKRFVEDVRGTYEGVGMEIGIRKGQLQVIAPLEGTPAQKAGLRAGDKILEIDGNPTTDITIDEAVELIRGPKGTEVALTILRKEWDLPKEFKVKRAVIEIPSLKWELKEEEIAYIQLYQFTEKASSDFKKAALEILNSPAKKIILDVRNNPGGYLRVVQDIAGWFLEKGKMVAIEDFGKNKKNNYYKSPGPASFLDYPLVVLINEGSASGSEILAGALRDNRGVLLIGEKTFGKGSVQELEKLSGGSSLKVTVAHWLTPKGELITERGLEPDIKAEISEEDFEAGRDPQLEKAIEILKNL